MPMYDYECPSCPHRFTVRQGYHDARKATCPECGDEAKQRISMPAVVFKGSGFYVNDYGGRKTGQPSSRESDDDGGDSGGDSSNGDGHDHASAGASDHSHPHPHPH